MGLRNIMLEEDVLGIITVIKSSSLDLSSIGNLIDEARLFSKDFEACLIKHVRRNANIAAYTSQTSPCPKKNGLLGRKMP
ncbi:hypothetical protein PTKIN_Ptkin08bG0084700 [Pterospermum kingtungense]